MESFMAEPLKYFLIMNQKFLKPFPSAANQQGSALQLIFAERFSNML
jgi:hypothetical protein